jgi:hypothetical protein
VKTVKETSLLVRTGTWLTVTVATRARFRVTGSIFPSNLRGYLENDRKWACALTKYMTHLVPRFLPSHSALFSPSVVVPVFRTGVYLRSASVVFTSGATRNSRRGGDRDRRSDPAEVRLCGGDSAGHGNRVQLLRE